jgi:hypothetical protein
MTYLAMRSACCWPCVLPAEVRYTGIPRRPLLNRGSHPGERDCTHLDSIRGHALLVGVVVTNKGVHGPHNGCGDVWAEHLSKHGTVSSPTEPFCGSNHLRQEMAHFPGDLARLHKGVDLSCVFWVCTILVHQKALLPRKQTAAAKQPHASCFLFHVM